MRQVIVAILALHLVACSSASNGPGDGGPGASGGSRGTGGSGGTGATAGSGGASATGGSGGAVGTCGLGDQDCICPGGYFTCQNDRTTCVCPPTCTRSDQCGSDAICVFQDGNCGGGASGYCLSPARAATWICAPRPTCGCDGKLYDDACAAVAARVSPSAAATSACASQPQPCTSGSTSGPSTTSCFPTEYCMISNGSGSTSASCSRFDISCAQPSCDCLSYNAASCHCDLLSTGLVRLTCNF